MQVELSDDQVRLLRQAVEEAHDRAAETRRWRHPQRSEPRREHGEGSEEVREQDKYLAELSGLLTALPDPDQELVFVPSDRSRPFEYEWSNQNEDHPEINDISSIDVEDGELVLRCNEEEARYRFRGTPKPNVRELQRLEQYPLMTDDPGDYAAAYGVELTGGDG